MGVVGWFWGVVVGMWYDYGVVVGWVFVVVVGWGVEGIVDGRYCCLFLNGLEG